MKKTNSLPNSSGTSRSKITRRSFTRGFTLIEMLVVIAIIAILSGIIMTNLSGAKGKARDAKRISDLGSIQVALSLYFDRCDRYPNVTGGGVGIGETQVPNQCSKTNTNTTNAYMMTDFIASIPTPPTGVTGQTVYEYAINSSNNTDYVLHTTLESSNAVVTDGLSEAVHSTKVWATGFSCYDAASHPRDYCIGPK